MPGGGHLPRPVESLSVERASWQKGGPIDIVNAREAAGRGYLDCSVNVISHYFSIAVFL